VNFGWIEARRLSNLPRLVQYHARGMLPYIDGTAVIG
jgi:hypothetical protein